jgi:hypothetical protein
VGSEETASGMAGGVRTEVEVERVSSRNVVVLFTLSVVQPRSAMRVHALMLEDKNGELTEMRPRSPIDLPESPRGRVCFAARACSRTPLASAALHGRFQWVIHSDKDQSEAVGTTHPAGKRKRRESD